MAAVLFLHSALGLRRAVVAFADRLRAAGHTVSTPDLYDGRVFEGGKAGYDEAVAFQAPLQDEITAKVDEAYEELARRSGPVVTAGASMGTMHAQRLAVTHENVVGSLFIAGGGCYPEFLGEEPWADEWPSGKPLALHWMIDDPWMDREPLTRLIERATRAGSDVSDYVYPGSGHLFFDDGLEEEYDATAASLLDVRALGFLSRFE